MHLEVKVGVDKPTLIALPPIPVSTAESITYVFLRDDEGKLVKKFGLVPTDELWKVGRYAEDGESS